MTDVPHITYPFTLDAKGHPRVVEQDTLDEIVNCTEVIVRTDIGALQDLPEFGITDPTFARRVDINALRQQINTWEPRAQVQLSASFDSVDQLVQIVQLEVSTRGQL